MRINNNLMAMNTHRQLGINNNNMSKSIEKLSSGMRINRAGDDAAGLAISEKMRAQVRGLNQASRNAQDGISMIQTAEGALNETHSILQRMRELAVQANNGTNDSTDLSKIQTEIDELVEEIDGIATRTEFNTQKLLNGDLGAKIANAGGDVDGGGSSMVKIVDVTGAEVGAGYNLKVDAANEKITLTNHDGSLAQTIDLVGTDDAQVVGTKYTFDKIGVTIETTATAITGLDGTATDSEFDVTASGVSFQIGANSSQKLDLSINSMEAADLGTTVAMSAIDVTDFDTTSFDDQLAGIDEAISSVSVERSKLGAYQNRLEHTIKNLDTSSENLSAAESRIRDVDMAAEMMEQSKNSILSQAAQAMLAQAKQAPQGVLQLLR